MTHISVLWALIWFIFRYCKSRMFSLSVLLAPTCLASVLEAVNCFPGKRVCNRPETSEKNDLRNCVFFLCFVPEWFRTQTSGQRSLILTAALCALSYFTKYTISDLKSGHDHFLITWHSHQTAHSLFNEHPEEQTKTRSSPLQRGPKRPPLTLFMSRTVLNGLIHERACERLCERRLQRCDNLPHKTTTRKMLMCLNCCMSSLPTLCSYWFTPPRQYTSQSSFITPYQTDTMLKLTNILNFTSVCTGSCFLFALCMLYRT